MPFMIRIGVAWVANVVALLAAEAVEGGLEIEPEWRVLTAGAVIGVVNWAIRPVRRAASRGRWTTRLRKLAAPFIILTLGLAIFAVNLVAIYLASEISPGITLDDFDASITVAIFLWIANALVQAVLAIARRREERAPEPTTNARRR